MDGMAQNQVNFRSNNTQHLNRRPPVEFVKELGYSNNNNIKHFWYTRRGIDNNILVNAWGDVFVWVGDDLTVLALPTTTFDPNIHDVRELIVEEINDTVFIANPKIPIVMDTNIIGKWNVPTHINITTALNYEDTLSIKATRLDLNGNELYSKIVSHSVVHINYTSGSAVDYSAADTSRSTAVIAADIAQQLNGSSWGGFLGYLSGMFNSLNSIAGTLLSIGTANGWSDYIAGASGITSQITSITAQVDTILGNMSNFYGGTAADARIALATAQAEQTIAQGEYEFAVANLAADPTNTLLIAIVATKL